jgi:ubiquitin-protein ligase E3 C
MFQSFTGSSRKPRQVNLSGHSPTPRRNLPPAASQKQTGGAPGGQAAIAQAQAQRAQRELERERLNAGRRIQRAWRGHASRRRTKEGWRGEWDGIEVERTDPLPSGVEDLLRKPEDGEQAWAYKSAEECYAQMRLLLHFLDIKMEMDRARLAYFGAALRRTLEEVPSIATGGFWTVQLYRLSKLAVDAVDVSATQQRASNERQLGALLSLLLFLSCLIPKHMAKNARRYYGALAGLLSRENRSSGRLEFRIGEAVLALLTPITAETMTAYIAFGAEYLTVPGTLAKIEAEKQIAPKLNYTMLTAGLVQTFEEDPATKSRILGKADRSLWLLAHLIFFHQHSLGVTGRVDITQETNHLKLLSTLLDAQASEIKHRIDIVDVPMSDSTTRGVSPNRSYLAPLPPFVRTQILTLVEERSITSMISQLRPPKPSEGKVESDSAQALANYALTLIRVLPKSRADNIRKWLYDGSAGLRTSTDTSAISYFWQYSRSTTVYQKISKDHRNAVSFLKPFVGAERSMSVKSVESIQQDWRILLLFLELYSFAISQMDDEEFLAGGKFGAVCSTDPEAKIRDGSLPLSEVRDLTTFLKNLAFALYWDSKDWLEWENSEQSHNIGAYFGTNVSNSPKRHATKSEDKSRESAKGQLDNLKNLATGLLRSIHQRE